MDELVFLSATAMAEKIRKKEISPVELVRAHLARIEQVNPRLNAIVWLDAERALAEAREAEAALQSGQPLGPLHGVPITVKSSLDVAGWRAPCGSKLRANYVAAVDAPLVARLWRAGAILLGNTNAAEFLMAYETHNVLHGRTNNPWDLERTPGGSSGGEAAAIAAGCSAAGVGSDGGGSIRVPAHFCGICGLKPTPGRIPATGHFPPSVGPFAWIGVVGPMARTVGDLQILFRVLAGPDVGDPSSAPITVRAASDLTGQRLRVGYFESDGRNDVTPATRVALRRAAAALEQQGIEVVKFAPEGLEQIWKGWWTLFGRAAPLLLRPLVSGHEAELSPILSEYLEVTTNEPPLTAGELLNTLIERDVLRERFLRQMEGLSALLCPVYTVPAFRHGEIGWRDRGKGVSYLNAGVYVQWFNLLGYPAAVVPVGRSPEGLPIGVQVVGKPWEEEVVLEVAARIEHACGGWNPPPI